MKLCRLSITYKKGPKSSAALHHRLLCRSGCQAAVTMLLSNKAPDTISVLTPKGLTVEVPVLEVCANGVEASCAVRKDAGDDPDITNSSLVYAKVTRCEAPTITIDGGVVSAALQSPVLTSRWAPPPSIASRGR